MIVDFQHHFTPRELIKEDPGDRLILHYDAQGAPSYTIHSLLYDLDEHVKMMDLSGIDAAWLTSAQGMCADLETSRFVNDKAKKAEKDYPGRFIARGARQSARRPRRAQGAQPLPARARLPGRGHHLRARRQIPRQSRLRAVLDRGRAARDVRVRASRAEAQLLAAVRRLRYRALGRPRILADHGDHPPGQFRRVRPSSESDDPHGASVRRHGLDARPHPQLSRTRISGAPRATRATAPNPKRRISTTTSTTI